MNEALEAPVTVTHGLCSEDIDDSKVYRKIGVQRLSDGGYVLYFETRWPDQLEPVKTLVELSETALNMLGDTIYEATQNMDDYPALTE